MISEQTLFPGAANLDISKNRKIAIRTITYFVLTSVFNVVLGITLGLVVQPGQYITRKENKIVSDYKPPKNITFMDGFLDMGR